MELFNLQQQFPPRWYQEKAVERALEYMETTDPKKDKPSYEVLPTGSGKSLVIANIAKELKGRTVVLQPSKEILMQNYRKLQSYGVDDIGIWSASAGRKDMGQVTYATVGSVMPHIREFGGVDTYIMDECHLMNPAGGQYKTLLTLTQPKKVLGLTATPYRLKSYGQEWGSKIMMLNRTRPKFWERAIHVTQINEIQEFMSPLTYQQESQGDTSMLRVNTTGADYTDASLKEYMQENDLRARTYQATSAAIAAGRKHILVFTPTVKDAEDVVAALQARGVSAATVSGKTPQKQRDGLLNSFMQGHIQVMANVGVLTTGFDFPELDCIILGRPTMSLALYYQIVGRALRPHKDKPDALIVDLCGSINKFGRVEDLTMEWTNAGHQIFGTGGRQLTGVQLEEFR